MSVLAAEIEAIPAALADCADAASQAVEQAAESWRRSPPATLFTIARGSSDAAATFAACQIARHTGVPVGSFTPSLASLLGFKLASERILALGISQSGASPDLVAALECFARPQRWALVNVAASPMASAAGLAVPIGAGDEVSVAATKSFACSIYLLHRLAMSIGGRPRPDPARAAAAAESGLADACDLALFDNATHAFVLGRGTTLGLAQEIALKLKELAGLHAEALSSAEAMHGPKALAGPALAVLAFAPPGEVGGQVKEAAAQFSGLGCPVATLAAQEGEDDSEAFLRMLASAYVSIPALARRRGLDPDDPQAITKVTLTR